MGTCIKCGNTCKDNHSYCKECFKKQIEECKICNTLILQNEKYIEMQNHILICQKCYETIYKKINKYIPTHKAKDGHWVRSRLEMLVDNYLFDNNIPHIYEKTFYDEKNPEKSCTADFFLPTYKTYIEIWGYDNNEKYENQKTYKEKIYKENNVKLINIYPEDIDKGIEDFLSKEFLKLKKEL